MEQQNSDKNVVAPPYSDRTRTGNRSLECASRDRSRGGHLVSCWEERRGISHHQAKCARSDGSPLPLMASGMPAGPRRFSRTLQGLILGVSGPCRSLLPRTWRSAEGWASGKQRRACSLCGRRGRGGSQGAAEFHEGGEEPASEIVGGVAPGAEPVIEVRRQRPAVVPPARSDRPDGEAFQRGRGSGLGPGTSRSALIFSAHGRRASTLPGSQ